jgi:hypothetical protein
VREGRGQGGQTKGVRRASASAAAADIAAANKQKAQVLQDQAALNLFTMPGADPAEVAEYLRLRRKRSSPSSKNALTTS